MFPLEEGFGEPWFPIFIYSDNHSVFPPPSRLAALRVFRSLALSWSL